MPQRVVDDFETIQIDEEGRERDAVSFRMGNGVGESVFEQDAVGESSQAVVIRKTMNGPLRLLAFGDVLSGSDDRDFMALFVPDALRLEVDGEVRTVGQDQAVIEIAGRMMGHDLSQGVFHPRAVVRMHQVEEGVEGAAEILRTHTGQSAEFVRHAESPRARRPVPIADARDALGELKPGLALHEGLEDVAGPEHVPDVMAENRRIDRFVDEVRGPVLIRLGDRGGVLEARHDEDRKALAPGERADLGTGDEPVHAGHDQVEHDQIRGRLFELSESLPPAFGLKHLHAGRFQRGADEDTGGRIVVDDENDWAALGHRACAKTEAEKRTSAVHLADGMTGPPSPARQGSPPDSLASGYQSSR